MSERTPESARDDLLPPTPGQTVGPFFGYALPYARGNELVEAGTPGAVRLHGTVYDGAGAPVPDALIEIWQADPAGAVVGRSGSLLRDGTFTGWGRAETDREGGYWFRTLTPGATEPGRAPFFAVTVFARGLQDRLHTRAYLPDADLDAAPRSMGPDGVALYDEGPDVAALHDEGPDVAALHDEGPDVAALHDEGPNGVGPDGVGTPAAEALLASLEPGRRATLVTSREPDGSLRFDIRLQGGPEGEEETVFLTYDTAAHGSTMHGGPRGGADA
ncbi:protocatechuate 3,4-dioxygenase subunit alpha [Promicromonospora sp. NPDC090134]|uniref:protocatechuate 3,4-dioxygenase subunit alpha n=1 Tax=Promicromonospora sp. NPDC090134 TaxID=3364408 RepID=UPI00382148CF